MATLREKLQEIAGDELSSVAYWSLGRAIGDLLDRNMPDLTADDVSKCDREIRTTLLMFVRHTENREKLMASIETILRDRASEPSNEIKAEPKPSTPPLSPLPADERQKPSVDPSVHSWHFTPKTSDAPSARETNRFDSQKPSSSDSRFSSDAVRSESRIKSAEFRGRLIKEIPVNETSDVVISRNAARDLAQEIGFGNVARVKIATAVSELARNIYFYAKPGHIKLYRNNLPMGMTIIAEDNGPGIPDIELVLSGAYKSKTGMGKGLLSVRKIVDAFDVDSAPGKGTKITIILNK
ncbi:MAG: anti-sigma regulatory factor [Planctomycetota bacterium]